MDTAARYGGEEFVLILPNFVHSEAVDLANRLRLRVAEEPFVFQGQNTNATMSLGVSSFLKTPPRPRRWCARPMSGFTRPSTAGAIRWSGERRTHSPVVGAVGAVALSHPRRPWVGEYFSACCRCKRSGGGFFPTQLRETALTAGWSLVIAAGLGGCAGGAVPSCERRRRTWSACENWAARATRSLSACARAAPKSKRERRRDAGDLRHDQGTFRGDQLGGRPLNWKALSTNTWACPSSLYAASARARPVPGPGCAPLDGSPGGSWVTLERYLQERGLTAGQPHCAENPEAAVGLPIQDNGELLGYFYAPRAERRQLQALLGKAQRFVEEIGFAFRGLSFSKR